MRAIAPAKINLTLEVLGKREDGYHEIRSVIQTIDLVDEVSLLPSDELRLEVEGEHTASDDDLVLQAVRTMEETHGLRPQGLLRLVKRIPAGAGLGGGSSDAAAAMRLVDRLHKLGEDAAGLAAVAERFSSDGPFFCYGGTALVSGRGEIVEPLPDAPRFWLLVLTPRLSIPDKTKRMYEALRREDFTDGSRSSQMVERIRTGSPIDGAALLNVFHRAAHEVFEGLEIYRDALMEAGAESVHVAGSGPSLYALAEKESEARTIADRLEMDAKVFVARFMEAAEATALHEA